MKTLLIGAVLAVTASSNAWASEFPQCFDKYQLAFVDCPGYGGYGDQDWSGYYIGVHAGYADLDLSGGYDLATSSAVVGHDVDANGFAGGGHAGVAFQQDFYVLGMEIDASVAEMEARTTRSGGGDLNSVEAVINGFGSIRGRFGVAVDNVQPFFTAGVGMVSYKLTVDDKGDNAKSTEEDSAFVGVVGGGLEVGLTDEISIRGEGLYYYIDEDVAFTEPGGAPENLTIEDLWTLRGGVNWRL